MAEVWAAMRVERQGRASAMPPRVDDHVVIVDEADNLDESRGGAWEEDAEKGLVDGQVEIQGPRIGGGEKVVEIQEGSGYSDWRKRSTFLGRLGGD